MKGPTVAVVFGPDPDLGPDPLDRVAMPRRLGELISPGTDLLLVWREWGGEFTGGCRTHVVAAGAWEHVGADQIEPILESLGNLT